MRKHALAIVGGNTLLGCELRDLLSEGQWAVSLKLVGADADEYGVLTEQDGEAVVLTELDAGTLTHAEVVFLAGSAEAARKALQLAREHQARAAFIDLSYAFEDAPDSRLRAPVVEPPDFEAAPGALQVMAHPAAVALAIFLTRLHAACPLRRIVAQILEPASELGRNAVNELQAQTISLLSFKPLPKKIFDEQVAFNLLSSYGSEASGSLQEIEQRIERHLATLLERTGPVPMPSLRLIQAPVFHGHAISVWAEFEQAPAVEELERALHSPYLDVRGRDVEPPTNVGIAGQSGVAVGSITPDRNNNRAYWFWLVADNVRLSAENAIAVARALLVP